jgi:CrcB protein
VTGFPVHAKLALLVAAGGAIGSAARYGVGALLLRWLGPNFPWGTICVNIAGSFLMGVVTGFAVYRLALSADMRLFLATGVLGGFTTFSAFALDSYFLYERNGGLAAIYILASVMLSLAALLAGIAVERVL